MLGAIIGDLAASTYLRDKEEFNARLIGDTATISELSVAVLWVAQAANDWDRFNDPIRLKQFIDYIWSL